MQMNSTIRIGNEYEIEEFEYVNAPSCHLTFKEYAIKYVTTKKKFGQYLINVGSDMTFKFFEVTLSKNGVSAKLIPSKNVEKYKDPYPGPGGYSNPCRGG